MKGWEMSRIIIRVYQRERVMILFVSDWGVFKNGCLCTYVVREQWKNVLRDNAVVIDESAEQ